MITLTSLQNSSKRFMMQSENDIYKSELKENGDEPDAAHIDLFNAVNIMKEIYESY